MKSGLLSATLLVALALILGACDSSTNTPQPTATAGLQPTTPAQGNATPAPATAAATSGAISATTVPTATQTTATTVRGPLTLSPVTVETSDATRKGAFATDRTLNMPQGFHIGVYALVSGVRWLEKTPQGAVYATSPSEGKVYLLPDDNKDGVADAVKVFADNLPGVHGIAFHDDALFVATETDIIKLTDTNNDGVADKREVLASDLPADGQHTTRTLVFGADGNLYVSAGSSCNVCQESDPKRAAISLYSVDGKFQKIFASGLRNAVGLQLQPGTNQLWATNNGRDNLGDNIPPDTIYNVQDGANYGWPFCYGNRVPDTSQNPPAGFCEKTSAPAVQVQAHSAPLGLAFYDGGKFPQENNGDLFVAFHGSWNRSVPTGYKLVRISFKNNQPDNSAGNQMIEDFATGWQTAEGDVWGRPVDPFVAPDGTLFLTDDNAGAIYRIYYSGQ
jgi:glucose/arabinose dehydrogenase